MPAVVGKLPLLFQMLDLYGVQVVALQEVSINLPTRQRFRNVCRQHGFNVVFGGLDEAGVTKVALLSSLPISEFVCESPCPDRIACGAVELRFGAGSEIAYTKLLVSSVYAHACDEVARESFLKDCLRSFSLLSTRWLALGDFNLEVEDPALAPYLASGAVHCLDQYFPELPEATRRDGHRRIDFGLAHPALVAVQRVQSVDVDFGMSDHDLVAYGFEVGDIDVGSYKPHRPPFFEARGRDALPDCDAELLRAVRRLLDGGAVDQAWTLLSDLAEDQLCSDFGRGVCRRSSQWRPTTLSKCSKAAVAPESVHLIRLRRFHRRLLHLGRRPHEDQLRARTQRDADHFRAILRAATGHHCGLPSRPDRLAELAAVVDSIIKDEEKEVRDHRLKAWKARVCLAPDKQRTWVKTHAQAHVKEMRSAGPSPTLGGVTAAAIHPARVVLEQQAEWTSYWRQRPGLGIDLGFRSLLADVPVPDGEILEVAVTVEEFQLAMRAMTSKAAGPDKWDAGHLLQMGPGWWTGATEIWNHCLTTGDIPQRWMEARVILIPKPMGGHRPLAVASVLWRAGARATLKHLKPWIDSWAACHLFGGLPSRGAEDALHWIYHGLVRAREDGIALRQDIHRYFDSIDFEQGLAVLDHLRAPASVTRLLRTFYARGSRIFAVGPFQGDDWQRGFQRGVLQGCPLSPLVGAAVMLPWLHQECAVYMDDRVLWASEPSSGAQLRLALDRTELFDRVFGFRCRPSKCGIAASSGGAVADFGLDHLEYPFDTKFAVLGVVFDFCDLSLVQMLNFDIDIVLARITDITRVVKSWSARFALLRTLVVPVFTWAAGVTTLPAGDVSRIRNAILGSFGTQLPPDVPWGPFFEILGWQVEPTFALVAAAIRAATRCQAAAKAWLENAPLHFAASTWPKALHDLGWGVSADATCILRPGENGTWRKFHLGQDCFGCVFGWLTEARRAASYFASARVRKVLHRAPDPEFPLAQGLQLPLPGGGIPCYGGHRLCALQASDDRELFLASLAVGCNWWHFHRGSKAPRGDPLRLCACGGFTPSRPHLVWVCPHTAEAREGVQPPADRGEERLFAKAIPPRPAPPGGVPEGLQLQLADCVERKLREDSCLFIATDGSAIDEVAAFAVVVPDCPPFVSGLDTEAQTAYRAEVDAATFTLEAAALATSRLVGLRAYIVIVIDCQAAITTLKGGGKSPNLARRAHDALCRLRALAEVEVFWIPAHDKIKSGWVPHRLASEGWLCGLNDAADKAARAEASRLLRGSQLQRWLRLREDAVKWEAAAIKAAAATAKVARAWWWAA